MFSKVSKTVHTQIVEVSPDPLSPSTSKLWRLQRGEKKRKEKKKGKKKAVLDQLMYGTYKRLYTQNESKYWSIYGSRNGQDRIKSERGNSTRLASRNTTQYSGVYMHVSSKESTQVSSVCTNEGTYWAGTEEIKRGEVYNGFTILVSASHKCILQISYWMLLDFTAQNVNQQNKS
jgi:hypothetical protein